MSRAAQDNGGSDWYRDDNAILSELQTLHRPAPQFAGIRGYSDLRELRRGGQGVVYSATQLSTRRRVAIKVLLDAGGSTDEARRRFEREVDLVSHLSHAHIVRVFDRGTTDDRRQYCVMEYIDGASLDQLMAGGATPFKTIPDALRFFVKICDAVQYAHQRGVIHRDLKPSNVCVDRAGEPHVLDFGLAKATSANGREMTQFSQTGQFMGSLPWASPEQVDGTPDQVDVRTDVYSLGVMLYQLLTAKFPYEVTGPLSQIFQNIRSATPAPPSRLRQEIDEDLSTLVLKCLAKEPERRYASVGELARDIRHYLAGEPLEAKRDNAWYAARKALRRYRTAARVATVFLVASLGVAVWLALLWQRAIAAERLAADRLVIVEAARSAEERAHAATAEEVEKAKKITAFLDTTLRFVDPWKDPGRDITPFREMLDSARKRLDESFDSQPEVAIAIAGTIGNDYWTLGLLDDAEPLLRRAYEQAHDVLGKDHPTTLAAMHDLGSMLTDRGKHEEAEQLLHALVETQRRVFGPGDARTLRSLNNLAYDIDWQGRVAEAAELYAQALEGERRVLGSQNVDTLRTMNNLAIASQTLGKSAEAERLFQEVIEGRTALFGAKHPETLQAKMNLAQQIVDTGRLAEGEALLRGIRDEITAALGPGHPLAISATGNLASVVGTLGRKEESLALDRQAYEAQVAFSGPDSPQTLQRKNQILCSLIDLERFDEAIPLARELARQFAESIGPGDLRTLTTSGNLAYVLSETNAKEEAESLWKQIVADGTAKLGPKSQPVVTSLTNLGKLYADEKRWAEADTAYTAAVQAMKDLSQDNTWRFAVMLSGLGRVQLETGRLDDAEASLGRAYQILSESFGDAHERTQQNLKYFVRVYEAKGDVAQVARLRAKMTAQATKPAATAPAGADDSK